MAKKQTNRRDLTERNLGPIKETRADVKELDARLDALQLRISALENAQGLRVVNGGPSVNSIHTVVNEGVLRGLDVDDYLGWDFAGNDRVIAAWSPPFKDDRLMNARVSVAVGERTQADAIEELKAKIDTWMADRPDKF
jgi:hypothetical protein